MVCNFIFDCVTVKTENKLTIFITTADTLYLGEGLVTSKYRLNMDSPE